jgi:hypothetical protein
MKKILALGFVLASMGAIAEDDVKYSLGLKNWNHTMTGPERTSLTVNSPLVSGSIKYKDFSFTASSLLQTTYVSTDQTYVMAVRTDTDYAFGYTIYDKVTLLIGSKTLSGTAGVKDMVGTFYGVSLAQPINDEGYVFGTFAQSNNISNLDGLSADGKFSLADVGYGHLVNKNTTLNIGYRQQIFTSAANSKYTLGGITFGVGFNF